MAVPSYIADHSEQAYENLLGQFKDKPIIQAILQTWTDKLQEVEDDLYSLMTKTLFLNAEGANLERYGQLFGIKFPKGLTDREYKELLIAEILRRSSDGTPNRIRQILEATTGITSSRIFEHYNGNQKPFIMGAHLVYGYADESVDFDVSIETREARYLKWASPITTGSCVLGVHRYGESSLFIPSEIEQETLQKFGLSSNKTTNHSFETDLAGWSNNAVGTFTYERLFDDPTTDHHDGAMRITASTAQTPEVYQQLTALTIGQSYVVTANISDTATSGLTLLTVGTTQGGSDLGSSVTLDGDGRLVVTFTATTSNPWINFSFNTEGFSSWSCLLDAVETYNTDGSFEQDELVDQVSDWIAIKDTTVETTFGLDSANGVLAEFGNQIERFQVEPSLTGIPTGIEDFSVDTSLGIEDFNVEYSDPERPTANAGICLEISQITLTEDTF